MNNFYTNKYPIVNLYKNNSTKSEIVSQMLFGESFKIINKYSKWIHVKIKEDGYVGYIKNKKFIFYLKPTHKVCVLSANIYKNSNFKKKNWKTTISI
jgi:hypothetical protein